MGNAICGAKTKVGTPCEQRAGWGTDHVGEGRCKLHGGKTPRGAESPHFRHGGRSKYFDSSQIVGFDEWEATVGPQLALEKDLLAMIYMVREWLLREKPVQVMTKFGSMDIKPDPDYITRCLDRLSRTWERMVKRREGETIHVKIAQPEVERAFEAVADAVVDTIEDLELARRVGDAIAEALKGIGGGEA